MRKWITLVLLLLVGAEVFAQGSAPSPPQVWRRVNDSIYTRIGTTDTLRISSTGGSARIRTKSGKIIFPDTVSFGGNLIWYGSDADRYMIFNSTLAPESIQTFLGSGLEIVNHALTNSLGTDIDSTEARRWQLGGTNINPLSSFTGRHWYKGIGSLVVDTAFTESDSELVTFGYASSYLAGIPITNSSPADGKWPIYNQASNTWQFGSVSGGGGGSMTVDTTYNTSGSQYNPSGIQHRSGQFVAYSKASGGDTVVVDLFHGASLRYGSNAGGTQWYPDTLYVVGTTTTDTFFMVYNNSTTTILDARGENNAIRINKPTTISGNLSIGNSGDILSANQMDIDVSASGGLSINVLNGQTTNIGLSPSSNGPSFYISGDTLSGVLPAAGNTSVLKNISYIYGNNMLIDSAIKVVADTASIRKVIKMRSDSIRFLSSGGQVAKKIKRDEIQLTTTDSAAGILRIVADPGLVQIDSVRFVGAMYSANKPLDSLSRISIRGSAAGKTAIDRATGGSDYTITLPNAAPSGRKVFGYESGSYGWIPDSNSGSGGNGNVKWDTCGGCALQTGADKSDSAYLFGKTQRIARIRQTASGVTQIDAGDNTTLRVGPTGIAVFDSVARFPTNAYFGNSIDTTIRLYKELVDSVKNARGRFRVHTATIRASMAYGRPKAPGSSDSVFLTGPHFMDTSSGVLWTWTDSTCVGTDTDYVYQEFIFPDTMRVDSIAYVWITGAADTTLGVLDTIKVYKRYSMGSGLLDSLIVTNAARKFGTTATRAVFAVNGSTGVGVGTGETWVIKFRNKLVSDNAKVRVFGVAAKGVVR